MAEIDIECAIVRTYSCARWGFISRFLCRPCWRYEADREYFCNA